MNERHRPERRLRRWLALLGMAAALLCPVLHAAMSLDGAWREALPGDTPQRVLADYRQGLLHGFDPAQFQHFPLRGAGAWVVLQPAPPASLDGRMLTIDPPPLGRVLLYRPDGSAITLALDAPNDTAHAHGRLAWPLGDDWSAHGPILLRFMPGAHTMAPAGFAVLGADAFRTQDARWLAFASACLAVMLAMALMAVCISGMLRDLTFAWYAGFVLCYAFIQGMRSGYLFHPLEMDWLAGSTPLAMAAATGLAMSFAALFAVRFCELRHYAPLLQGPALTLAAGMPLVVLLRACGIGPLPQAGQLLIEPLLILGSLLLGVAASTAAVRGARPAWFFLFGWMPLLVLVALWNAELAGTIDGARRLGDASLAAGALEALVLALGLANHVLRMRRTHASVQVLANHDALTNVLNRRAWRERVETTMRERAGRPMALLFLDLDHFKILNDRQGHAAGDRALLAVAEALRHELRPSDHLGRYGGEEFVAMLHDTSQEQATQIAIRLCRRVHRLEIPLDGEGSRLSVSIGLAMRQRGDTLDSWLERADQAMYTAKLGGRNRVQVSTALRAATRGRPALKAVE